MQMFANLDQENKTTTSSTPHWVSAAMRYEASTHVRVQLRLRTKINEVVLCQ